MATRKVLLIMTHPAYQRSRVNRHLIRSVACLENVTVHDLYDEYPDFMIDVEREQQLLLEHDAYVFQHPLYWYSTPSLLKEWQDLVLTHGWAFGTKGRALEGKIALQAITAGGGEEHYQPEGMNRYTIRQFLAPFEQTCHLCHMQYLAPFAVHGTHRIVSEEDLLGICGDYRALIEMLRDDKLDLEAAVQADYLNSLLPERATN